jgi:replicative DNA helicase
MSTAVAERTLPHNLEAERAVLAAILVHNDALNTAAELVTDAHFFREAHRRLYRHICQLSLQGVEIDLVSLKESLSRAGELDEVGGPAYLAALVDGVPRSTNIGHYATIVREKSELRSVIFAASKMMQRAYDAEDDAHDVVEEAERVIFQIAEGTARNGFTSVGALLPGVMQKLELICSTKQAVTGVPTGFTDLDELTRGLQPGNLILVAGRPSMGKTSFAMNVAEHVSVKVGLTVGVFTLEQSSEELMMRSIASAARIDGHRMQSGYLGERDWARLSYAVGALAEAKLHIDETANLGVFEMRARARRLKAEHGLDLLIIDYVQLMTSQEKKAENRTLELGAISRALKILARELQVPVVLLSQLSRAPELRSDHRPMLSDLRESGSLEQDADMVLFLYRDEYYHPDRDDNKGMAEAIIAKQRNGPLGTVKLVFLREYTTFENLARSESYEDRRLPIGDR